MVQLSPAFCAEFKCVHTRFKLPTALAGKLQQSIPSARPSVCIHATFELEFVCVRAVTIARLGLKVKVID